MSNGAGDSASRVVNRSGVWILAAALVFVAAVAARSLPFRDRVAAGGVVRVADPDACYHLRRATRMVEEAPTLAIFDRWLDPPRGAPTIWPPLWDLALAGALAIAPADPESGAVRAGVALLPPVVMGGVALLVFLLARRLASGRLAAALAAGLFVALAAADRPWTAFARLDHNAAELLAWAALALALARAMGDTERGPARRALLPGAALALGISVQAAFLIAAALPPLALLALPRARRDHSPLFLAALWGTAAALLLPFALLYARAGAPIAHTHFGLLQPSALASAAAFAAGWAAFRGAAERSPAVRLAGGALLLAALAGVVALAPELARGFGFLGRESAWIASIGESRSPLAGGGRGLGGWIAGLSGLVLALPLGAAALWRLRRAPAGRVAGASAVAFAWLAIGLALALSQARFVGHLLPPLGLALAAAWVVHLGTGRRLAVLAAAVGLAIVVVPQLRAAAAPERSELALARAVDVLAELRARDRAVDPPPAVVADWSFGHFLAWYGLHPATVDNFGEASGDLSFPTTVLLATDEATAVAAMERRGAGYLFVGELAETYAGLMIAPAERDRWVASSRGGAAALAVEFRPAIVRTVLYRAARQLGSAVASPSEGFVPPLRALRLVAESAAVERLADGRDVASYKLFERVAGVRLRVGGVAPGAAVLLEAEIETPRGRRFPYVDVVAADGAGLAELRFPYSTARADGAWAADLRVTAEGAPAMVPPAIDPAAVRSGATIVLR
jgi:asparagine N-glycosylation enzyme membrane subunit Stt3